jgi:hypothetical protein
MLSKLDKKIFYFMKKFSIPKSHFKKLKCAIMQDYSEDTTSENIIYNISVMMEYFEVE